MHPLMNNNRDSKDTAEYSHDLTKLWSCNFVFLATCEVSALQEYALLKFKLLHTNLLVPVDRNQCQISG